MAFVISEGISTARTELCNQLGSLEMNDCFGDADRIVTVDLQRLRGHAA